MRTTPKHSVEKTKRAKGTRLSEGDRKDRLALYDATSPTRREATVLQIQNVCSEKAEWRRAKKRRKQIQEIETERKSNPC